MIFELTILVFCLTLSAFYSGSEAIVLSIGMDRAKQLIENGGKKAKALEFMIGRPGQILTTILVGNNLVNTIIASVMTKISTEIFSSHAFGLTIGIATMLILIFGEIMPKTFARSHAEALVVYAIRFLQISYLIMFPVVLTVSWFIEKILGKNAHPRGRLVTKDDIEYMVSKAEKERTMDSKQIDLLSSILEFPTIKVKDIMIPRAKVRFVEADLSFPDVIEAVKLDNHSRYPVCKGDLEHTVGFLHVKDLAGTIQDHKRFDIKDYLKPPFFVYEHMKIAAVFDHMNKKKVHLALVKDENGLVVGVVTLEDIIEEIFGEIHDEHDDDTFSEEIEKKFERGILVEGGISLRELYNDFDIHIPLNDNYSTLAGFLLDMLGNTFPEEGQIIVWEGLSFDLVKVENHEIKEVKITDVDGEKHFFSKREASEAQKDDSKEDGPLPPVDED